MNPAGVELCWPGEALVCSLRHLAGTPRYTLTGNNIMTGRQSPILRSWHQTAFKKKKKAAVSIDHCCRKSNRSRDEEAGWDCCLEANNACSPPCLRALARFLLLAFSAVLALDASTGSGSGCWETVFSVEGSVIAVDTSGAGAAVLDGSLVRTGSFRCGLTARRRQHRHL